MTWRLTAAAWLLALAGVGCGRSGEAEAELEALYANYEGSGDEVELEGCEARPVTSRDLGFVDMSGKETERVVATCHAKLKLRDYPSRGATWNARVEVEFLFVEGKGWSLRSTKVQ